MIKAADELTVSDRDILEFEASGAICLRNVFPPEWIERLRRGVDLALEGGDSSQFQVRHSLAKSNPDIRAFVFESPAAPIARQLMRSRTARYYFDQLFVKEPGVEAPTPWHHDQPYWPVSGRQVISIWTPLDPVTKANSGLEYVKGSHAWGIEFRPVAFLASREATLPKSDAELLPDIEAHRERYEFLSWDMQPGDCLVHQARAIHGASGNTSRERRRRALAVRWLGDDARYRAPGGRTDPNLIDTSLSPGDPMISERFALVAG